MNSEMIPYQEIEKIADGVIASGIFPGFKTRPQVISLMLLCQAEGMHPMKAVQLFDILPTGKVGIKSSALQAAFQARGGKIKWLVVSDTECEAEFTAAGLLEPIRVRWDMNDAKRAGLDTRPPWRQYPKAMLAARVTTDGINRADPGARFGGLYPTEVARDIDDEESGKRGAKALFTAGYGEPGTAQAPAPEPEPEPTEEELESPAISQANTMTPEQAREAIRDAHRLYGIGGAVESKAIENERQAIREAFGTPLVDEIPKEPKSRRRGPEEPTGPIPEACPKCGSPISEYVSNSKLHPGRHYMACTWAYGQRKMMEDRFGARPEEAQGAVKDHYRAWKEAVK